MKYIGSDRIQQHDGTVLFIKRVEFHEGRYKLRCWRISRDIVNTPTSEQPYYIDWLNVDVMVEFDTIQYQSILLGGKEVCTIASIKF